MILYRNEKNETLYSQITDGKATLNKCLTLTLYSQEYLNRYLVFWQLRLDELPVDKVVHEGCDVVSAHILVVQVVGVFPHILHIHSRETGKA